jgi:hypothetical protein
VAKRGIYTELHDVTTQKPVHFIVQAVKTSNATKMYYSYDFLHFVACSCAARPNFTLKNLA